MVYKENILGPLFADLTGNQGRKKGGANEIVWITRHSLQLGERTFMGGGSLKLRRHPDLPTLARLFPKAD